MSAELSYVQLKTANEARAAEEVRIEQRKRNLLVLIRHHLEDAGFLDTVQMLSKEAGPALGQWIVCDNIDLATVLQEYEAYCYVKFKKFPKIAKRRTGGGGHDIANSKSRPPLSNQSSLSLPSIPCAPNADTNTEPVKSSKSVKQRSSSGGHRRKPQNSSSSSSVHVSTSSPVEGTGGLGLTGSSIGEARGKRPAPSFSNTGSSIGEARGKRPAPSSSNIKAANTAATRAHGDFTVGTTESETPEVCILKPIAGFAGYNSEMRELAAVISRDIYSHNPDVRWSDIIGLDTAKRLVKEAVVYPIKYPQLFTGILSPWKGLLLYGPPGTGKTMLAKAVATEYKTTFFNISASTIVSKWRGDSEKLVRVLFELARFHAPSTIFMDELESIMGQRSGFGALGGEHEGSRRMKTELLVQMDRLAKSSDLVFVLAASNLPWELDHAMLRRLEKRILVDLPNEEARCAMFKHYLPPQVTPPPFSVTSEVDYTTVAKLTEGYSGSDIQLICKEAAMKSVQQVFDRLETLTTVSPDSKGFTNNCKDIEIQPVRTEEVKGAIASTKPSATVLAKRYLEWQRDYESV